MVEQSNFFQGAQHTNIRDYAQFVNAEYFTTNHYHRSRQEVGSIVPIEHRSKEIDPEDVIYRRRISSQDLEMHIEGTSSSSSRKGLAMRMIKVRREVHTAEIVQFAGCSFTVYTFEPKDNKDEETLKT
ncbi:hypothetical protein V5O48_012427, partial [Marasmius crinis-equi]